MNPVLRAKAMLADPFAEWARIERESGDPAFLLSRYVAILALVPALFGFIGARVVGALVPGAGLVRAPWFDAGFGAIILYVESFIAVLALAFIINIVAPLFGGKRDFDAALKLAVYSFTPAWLVGIFLLMKAPKAQSTLYVALATACAFGLVVGGVVAQRAIFPGSGI
jgi:hypothetical protein